MCINICLYFYTSLQLKQMQKKLYLLTHFASYPCSPTTLKHFYISNRLIGMKHNDWNEIFGYNL